MKKNRYSKVLLSIALILGVLFIGGQAFAQNNVTGEEIASEAIEFAGNSVYMDSARGVQWIYDQVGIQLPGTLNELNQAGTEVRPGDQLQLGDIVLLGTTFQGVVSVDSPEGRQYIKEKLGIELPGYLDALWAILLVEVDLETLAATGVYVGDNQFIISHPPYRTIRVIDVDSSEWEYFGARRIVETEKAETSIRERVIQEGLKYLGTPYEFNSSRSSTATMDCSDFVRRAYYDATGHWIPMNSRTQFAYVEQYGKVLTSSSQLQRGDLVFFDSGTGRIHHVAIYMGNDQILHATGSRNVHVSSLSGYWLNRAYRGGDLLHLLE